MTTEQALISGFALTDAQLDALADRIADRLAARIACPPVPPTSRRLVTADELAAMLGTSRECVYRHSSELGAERIGDGPRARLRFDPTLALARGNAKPAAATRATAPPGNSHLRRSTAAAVPLLPVRGER